MVYPACEEKGSIRYILTKLFKSDFDARIFTGFYTIYFYKIPHNKNLDSKVYAFPHNSIFLQFCNIFLGYASRVSHNANRGASLQRKLTRLGGLTEINYEPLIAST